MISTVSLDLRQAVRGLGRARNFTLTAIGIVALSIAAVDTVFTLVDKVYLSALPYPDSPNTVLIRQVDQTDACRDGCSLHLSADALHELIRELSTEATIGVGHDMKVAVGTESATMLYDGVAVGPALVRMLAIETAVGRGILASDTLPQAAPVMVLSDAFWRTAFGGDSSVVGNLIELDGEAHMVVGVLRPHSGLGEPLFHPNEATAPYLIPISSRAATSGEALGFTVVARLRPTVTLEQFRAHARLAFAHARADWRMRGAGPEPRLDLLPLRAAFNRAFPSTYPMFLVAVLLATAVGAANLAALFLARQVYHTRETVVRAALGASTLQLLRPIWIEGLLICMAGWIAGTLIARWLLALIELLPLAVVPYWTTFGLDWRVIGASLLVSLAIALVIGLLPAIVVRRTIVGSLHMSGERASGTVLMTHGRRTLVSFQTASALVLLSSAGLLFRTLWTASHVQTGVVRHSLVFGAIDLSGPRRGSSAQQWVTRTPAEVLGTLRSIDGVRSAAVAMSAPTTPRTLTIESPRGIVEMSAGAISVNIISSGYLSTLGTAMLEGHELAQPDVNASSNATVIDENTARTLFGSAQVLGRRVKFGSASSAEPWRIIVGVAQSQRLSVVGRSTNRRVFFVPMQAERGRMLRFVVRTSERSTLVERNIQHALHALDAHAPIAEMLRIENLIGNQIAPLQVNAAVIGLFAIAGVVLAALGVYGITAYGIAQRQTEIAVRIALGAQRWDVIRVLTWDMLWAAGAGTALGLGMMVAATRISGSFIYQARTLDPVTTGAAIVATLAFAVFGAAVPAMRASRTDPSTSLRA